MVVEDDDSVSKLLSCLLADEGFQPVVARTGEDALAMFESVSAELILLDLKLPGLQGTEVLRHVRRKSDIPVIMVSGKRGDIDRIVGLEMGADDYVTKPFNPRELLARVRAVLRRQRPEALFAIEEDILAAGPVRMDVGQHLVTVGGVAVSLPLKEFDLLQMLLRNAGLVLTRARIIDVVWGPEYFGDTKTLDVHIRRLRAKIESDPQEPRHIITVRGVGYKFQATEPQLLGAS
jgi:two-component system response regulator RegX3